MLVSENTSLYESPVYLETVCDSMTITLEP